MKKEWNVPVVEILELGKTANGQAPSDNYDGDWVQINDKWYRPGNADSDGLS